jgi:2-oxoisovalerate dehydrogenase E1 component
VLFLLEHNGWAQSTDTRLTTPGDLIRRAAGFGLDADRRDNDDPEALREHLGQVVRKVRRGRPFLQIIDTRRLMPHSKGDDSRPKDVIRALWDADPLDRLLREDETARALREEARREVAATIERVRDRPLVAFGDDLTYPAGAGSIPSDAIRSDGGTRTAFGRIAEELNRGLRDLLAADDRVILLGEDLADPYGGAFKVTRGLSTEFPDRVVSTPIAEAAIAGVSNGLALAGMRPVAEVMFADFATLAADQLINFAAKFHAMYGGTATCPMTLRLVSGGGRGYGPTHSQSLERLFCGVPGLRVVALSHRHDPGALLARAVLGDDAPTVFVEHKRLYAERPATEPPIDLKAVECEGTRGDFPPLLYVPSDGKPADVTLVTYGGTSGLAEAAMTRLIGEFECRFDYVVLTQLWPLDVGEVLASVRRTGRLVVVEENNPDYSVGSAVIAAVAQGVETGVACRAVGARPVPIPAVRHLEDDVLPSVEAVVRAVSGLL